MIRAGATSRRSIDHDAAVRAAVQEARDPRKTRIERRWWMRARDVSHSAQYLLEHVSESIRRFGRSKERSTGQTRGPTYPPCGGLVPRHRVYSRDVTGHVHQSKIRNPRPFGLGSG
jgi:hypothetical protein